MDTGEQLRTERRGGLLSRLRPGEPAPPGEGLDGLIRTVKSYNAKADLKEIERAYRFAETHHEGQVRLSGEPFIEHPLAVARILADLGLDTTTLQAALLHDTVEDTAVTVDELEQGFGPEVARIVDDVLATGGTARATAKLVEQIGGKVVGISCLIELGFLHGRDKLERYDLFTLISY